MLENSPRPGRHGAAFAAPNKETKVMTTMRFDPLPASGSFSYHFPRALDAWDWLDANGFEERDPSIYHKENWRAELRRQPKDDGSKECWLAIEKLR